MSCGSSKFKNGLRETKLLCKASHSLDDMIADLSVQEFSESAMTFWRIELHSQSHLGCVLKNYYFGGFVARAVIRAGQGKMSLGRKR